MVDKIMKTIEELEKYAQENYIPIARKQTTEFMVNLIKENNYKSFFELGTAIGYTSILLKTTFPNLKVLTIEYNLKRANIAKTNFIDFGLEYEIDFIIGDAVIYETDEKFDLIFIDAAKLRNRFFLDKFSRNLNKGGTIIVDNMQLDDLWQGADQKKKAKYDLANQEFKTYALSLEEYETTIYNDIGDGIAVLKKK
jgi:predicted O-methyltransferase YrrM